jgi:hypothetical protein
MLADERSRKAVESGEQYADELIQFAEIEQVAHAANSAWLDDTEDPILRLAGETAFKCAIPDADELWQIDLAWADAALAIEGQEIRKTWTGTPEDLADALDSWHEAGGGSGEPVGWTEADPAGEMAELLRCIVGNPFRPVGVDQSWLTSTVVALARGIYDDRAFDRMPILADALQDAGCANADVLTHCRDTGPHARGCWVVDQLLGKG